MRKNREEKHIHIPCDAYPSCAGDEIVSLIKKVNVQRLFDLLIDETTASIEELEAYPYIEMYSYKEMLRHARNDEYVLFVPDTDYIKSSLFCEYAYVINLDSETLEFYKGFQTKPQKGNRYGTEVNMTRDYSNTSYYPCGLAAVFMLSDVEKMDTHEIVDMMENAEVIEDVSKYMVETPKTKQKKMDNADILQRVIAVGNQINLIAHKIITSEIYSDRQMRDMNIACKNVEESVLNLRDLADMMQPNDK